MCPKPHWSLSLICIFHGYTRPMVPGYSFSSIHSISSCLRLNPPLHLFSILEWTCTHTEIFSSSQYLKFSSIPTPVSFSCLFIFSDTRPLINKLFAQWLPDQQKNHRDPNPVYRSIIKDQWCFYQNRKP